jgi:chromosome segregation protein
MDLPIAPPRLLALRVQGFKSFAERTNVEFGGGISAVVGPNGSGKSNLADALRWALGEQGRALRSRKAEDWRTSRSSSTTPTACSRSTSRCSSSAGGCTGAARTSTC